MDRQKNDDTLTKLGDTFHYLIVLEHCLKLGDGESIAVEMYGDISKISDENSINIEVKHHYKPHKLGERNTDFWKSLKNWVENNRKMEGFKQLILITTSEVDQESNFSQWNILSKDEKYKIIQEIGSTIKKKEESFRTIYNEIFRHEKDVLLSILEKLIIYTGQLKIEEKYNQLQKDRFFLGIEKEKIPNFINELMGYILTQPINSPHTWYIIHEEFKTYVVEVVKRFSNDSRPLPDIYADKEPKNIAPYYKECFTEEILKIEYGDEEVREAIINYWRTKQTAIRYFHSHPIYLRDFNLYKRELEKKLIRNKRKSKRNFDITDERKCIAKSQDFYDESLELSAIPFGSVNPNRLFFQHGTIHEIVNEKKITWLMKDEKP
ncbi:ABC-three component system protein [Bacillus sp. FJAT-27245]|uniref:ABC-three component system protein n=1 Tax=Bacillus sp. FJAT-27245 TaxID=1684144 RepID=UPI0006A7BFD5|nr:ABC-three component system protein [Bacillus sp. FJAT-27245]